MTVSVKEVKLEQEFYKKLGMRSSAEEIFEKINNSDSKIIMDFDNIEFMSRSFAQEYVYQKRISDVEIEEKNMSGIVKEMYNIVCEDYEKHLSNK
jgi:23S rRNA pseudoU1915 N3-methylase RlmH